MYDCSLSVSNAYKQEQQKKKHWNVQCASVRYAKVPNTLGQCSKSFLSRCCSMTFYWNSALQCSINTMAIVTRKRSREKKTHTHTRHILPSIVPNFKPQTDNRLPILRLCFDILMDRYDSNHISLNSFMGSRHFPEMADKHPNIGQMDCVVHFSHSHSDSVQMALLFINERTLFQF